MKTRSSLRLALALGWAAVLPLAWPAPTLAQMEVSALVDTPPPALPEYIQPPIPVDGYLWIPGYWAWNGYDYFWVPGAWVAPPEPGLLWTPGYWGWNGAAYVFNPGYWGPTIGFYGGVNYGYGYFGNGFAGGYWRNGSFFYNSAVTNIGRVSINNVYVNNVTVNRNVANVSYNGGQGGLTVQPTAAERAAASQAHFAPTPAQTQNFEAARADRALTAGANHGVPPVAATPTAGRFTDPGVTRAEAYGGAPGGGGHALAPSVAVPHGVSNDHALPAPPHPAASGGLPGAAPYGEPSGHAYQAPPHPGPNIDRALPPSEGAMREGAPAAPHHLSPPPEPRLGAEPPPPSGGRAIPQAAGTPQWQRPANGRPPPHPNEEHREPRHPG